MGPNPLYSPKAPHKINYLSFLSCAAIKSNCCINTAFYLENNRFIQLVFSVFAAIHSFMQKIDLLSVCTMPRSALDVRVGGWTSLCPHGTFSQ